MTAARPGGWLSTSGLRFDRRQTRAGAARCVERERGALGPVLNFAERALCGQRIGRDRTQHRRPTARARCDRGHPHQPPRDCRNSKTELGAVGAELQAQNARAARQLQLVMLMGLLIAAGLVLLVMLLANARRRQDATLREARQQTTDILRTVKDGLFLLDEKLVIGTAYSSALESLFQRQDIAGLHFEELLNNIVSEKTLATALKFVKVLWAERTNEKLVKSINPLGEVEVHLSAGGRQSGDPLARFRVPSGARRRKRSPTCWSRCPTSAHAWSSAASCRARNGRPRLKSTRCSAFCTLIQTHLASFLSDSNAAMKMINAVLKEPAREESMFRKKLDTLFRQAHSVKGEAAALGLSSIESRAHSFEDDLKALREKPNLSGNDFLPLVIKLDDLLTHLQSVSELVTRLSKFQVLPRHEAVARAGRIERRRIGYPRSPGPVGSDAGLGVALQQLAERVARKTTRKRGYIAAAWSSYPRSTGASSRISPSKL